MSEVAPNFPGYDGFLRDLKQRIQTAQIRATLAVNSEMVLLYWSIGRDILARQAEQGWGAKVIQRLSADLRREFPDMKGFSRTNLLYMRAFAEAYPDEAIVQQVAGQIPWFHNCTILDKVKDVAERLWYIRATVEHGWSRPVLVHHIETKLYQRQGKAITNFQRTLPAPQSDLAQQVLKDPFSFDFLMLHKDARERELQEGLINHIRQFLLELGKGFAFVGSPYRLAVGGDEFEIDLLFYHLHLRCYVVIDLKIGKFSLQDAGQMNFYLSAVDDLLRHKDERPYQHLAIRDVTASLEKHQRKALIVMATGAGKTRTVIALCDLLQRCNWIKRVLFLANRVALVNQAGDAFKAHLPGSTPIVQILVMINKNAGWGQAYARS